MTLTEIATQLHGLSVGGYINGEKFSRSRLRDQLVHSFHEASCKNVLMQIALKDGQWYFTISEWAPGQYDYCIPETREQEERLLENFLGKNDKTSKCPMRAR